MKLEFKRQVQVDGSVAVYVELNGEAVKDFVGYLHLTRYRSGSSWEIKERDRGILRMIFYEKCVDEGAAAVRLYSKLTALCLSQNLAERDD